MRRRRGRTAAMFAGHVIEYYRSKLQDQPPPLVAHTALHASPTWWLDQVFEPWAVAAESDFGAVGTIRSSATTSLSAAVPKLPKHRWVLVSVAHSAAVASDPDTSVMRAARLCYEKELSPSSLELESSAEMEAVVEVVRHLLETRALAGGVRLEVAAVIAAVLVRHPKLDSVLMVWLETGERLLEAVRQHALRDAPLMRIVEFDGAARLDGLLKRHDLFERIYAKSEEPGENEQG